ncbi:hypothetical protein C8R44DRAFT_736631 [Mycena epipterygia]|nr:hypothetical protein C8R44DRAFT_736631 [Mycena epipterygia]
MASISSPLSDIPDSPPNPSQQKLSKAEKELLYKAVMKARAEKADALEKTLTLYNDKGQKKIDEVHAAVLKAETAWTDAGEKPEDLITPQSRTRHGGQRSASKEPKPNQVVRNKGSQRVTPNNDLRVVAEAQAEQEAVNSEVSNNQKAVKPGVQPTREEQAAQAKRQQEEAQETEHLDRIQRQAEEDAQNQGPQKISTMDPSVSLENAKRQLEGKSDEEQVHDHKRLKKVLDAKIEEGVLHQIEGRSRYKRGEPVPVPIGSQSLPVVLNTDSDSEALESPIYELEFDSEPELADFWGFRASRIAEAAAEMTLGAPTILNSDFGRGDDPDDPEDADYSAADFVEDVSQSGAEQSSHSKSRSSSREQRSSSSGKMFPSASSGSNSDSDSNQSESNPEPVAPKAKGKAKGKGKPKPDNEDDADDGTEAKTGLRQRKPEAAPSTLYGKWLAKSAKSREALEKKARKQVAESLRSQTQNTPRKPLDLKICGLIREVPGFCPEGAWTTYTIARECHSTVAKNLVCAYHTTNQGLNQHIPDGASSARWEIMGQPFAYAFIKDDVKEPIVDGYWHCGCWEADVLLDFFLWKSLILERVAKWIRKGYCRQWAAGKQRAFVCQLYRDLTGEDHMDVYKWNRTAEQHRRRQLQLRIMRMMEELADTAGPSDTVHSMQPPFDLNNPLLEFDPDDYPRKLMSRYSRSPGRRFGQGWWEPEDNPVTTYVVSTSDTEQREEEIKKILGPLVEVDDKNKHLSYAMQLEDDLHLEPAVKNWLDTAEVTQTELQSKVKALERELALARVDVALAERHILLHRSLLCTRKLVPIKIWAYIFHLAVDNQLKPYRCTWLLAHTCRAWRAVVLGDPSFWTNCDLRSLIWEGSDAEENESVDYEDGVWSRGFQSSQDVGYGGARPKRGLRSLDAIDDFLAKAPPSAPLDVTIDFSNRLDKAVLKRDIRQKDCWESVKMVGPELCTTQHKLREHISLLGNLPRLRRLELSAFDISLQNQALWQGNTVTEEDKLPWFQGALNLATVHLEAVLEPESTLDIAWANINSYTEISTRRIHVDTIPGSHLMRLTNLRILRLQSTWLLDTTAGVLTLPNLETLSMYYPTPKHPIAWYRDYDRLIMLCLPNLRVLKLDGRDLGFQAGTGITVRIEIATCVLNLLERSGSTCFLASLTIGLNTGLTEKARYVPPHQTQ